jgi:hypothetical protein
VRERERERTRERKREREKWFKGASASTGICAQVKENLNYPQKTGFLAFFPKIGLCDLHDV